MGPLPVVLAIAMLQVAVFRVETRPSRLYPKQSEPEIRRSRAIIDASVQQYTKVIEGHVVKVVSITDLRQDATKLVEQAQNTREPILICVRSRPAAYIVDADEFDALQRDVKQLRHELFWQGVGESESEHRAGQSQTYASADALIEDLGLDK